MMDWDSDFLEELREAFAVESEEYLNAITTGLVAMEKQKDSSGDRKVLEDVFRAVHSLKGSARAVDMTAIGMICQSMENVFSAVKKGSLVLEKDDFDILYRAADKISEMMASSTGEDQSMAVDVADELEALFSRAGVSQKPAASLAPGPGEGRIEPGDRPGQSAEMMETSRPGPGILEKHNEQEESTGHSETSAQAAGPRSSQAVADNVRIAASRLDAILLQSEELISVKLAGRQRVTELVEMLDMFRPWKLELQRMNDRMQAAWKSADLEKSASPGSPQEPVRDAFEKSFDWSYSQVIRLESGLRNLLKDMRADLSKTGLGIDQLLGRAKDAFMLPFNSMLQAFPRMVRDISREQDKEADLEITGADIEIDKRILDRMKDPLIHLLRNSIDHGLEKPEIRRKSGKPSAGKVSIDISQLDGGKVQVRVMDDGLGIDPVKVKNAAVKAGVISPEKAKDLDEAAALKLILHSGISTSAIITDLSGRGLGMAIVRDALEELGGEIFIESEQGRGTIYTISLPLTIATFRGILLQEWGRTFVMPTASVERVFRSRKDAVRRMENRETVSIDGAPVSLVRLGSVLELDPGSSAYEGRSGDVFTVMVIKSGSERMAFAADMIIDEQEVLFKYLGRQLERVRNVSGAVVLGSGKVVPVLNVFDLTRSAVKAGGSVGVGLDERSESQTRRMALVAEDTITSRMLLKNILSSAGFQVRAVVDGAEAWKALQEKAYDLVVSDVEMPGMNGFELTSKIRGEPAMADLPVVLVTGLESADDRERGIDVGADAYIVKSSFDQSNLLEVVRRLCG
jgi:two-component system, chemotaxis family, sensor kinase CheA